MNKIRHFLNQSPRIETGAIQFGDDWPGYFIRGDNAFHLVMQGLQMLKFATRNGLPDSLTDIWACNTLYAHLIDLLDSNLNERQVEMFTQQIDAVYNPQMIKYGENLQ